MINRLISFLLAVLCTFWVTGSIHFFGLLIAYCVNGAILYFICTQMKAMATFSKVVWATTAVLWPIAALTFTYGRIKFALFGC